VPPFVENLMGLRVTYYLIVTLFHNTIFTCLFVPHTALTTDIVHTFDQRTELTRARNVYFLLGALIFSFAHGQIISAFTDQKFAYFLSATICSIILLIPPVVVFISTNERTHSLRHTTVTLAKNSYFSDLKGVFSNKPYVLVTIVYSLSNLCVQFVQNNIILYTKYVLKAENLFSYLMVTLLTTATIFLFIWDKLSRRIGKKAVYYWGIGIWIVVECIIIFLSSGQVGIFFVLVMFAGVGISVTYLIPWSMLPDVVELDELKTGIRREGVYYSFFVFFQKVGLSFGLALSNFCLGSAGYITPTSYATSEDTQPDSVQFMLKILIGPVPAVILALSFIPMYFYNVDKESLKKMKTEIVANELTAQT